MRNIKRNDIKRRIPMKSSVTKRKNADSSQPDDILGIMKDKVEILSNMDPSFAIAIEEGFKEKNSITQIEGDFGKSWGDYVIERKGDTVHVEGDVGGNWVDYNIKKEEKYNSHRRRSGKKKRQLCYRKKRQYSPCRR